MKTMLTRCRLILNQEVGRVIPTINGPVVTNPVTEIEITAICGPKTQRRTRNA